MTITIQSEPYFRHALTRRHVVFPRTDLPENSVWIAGVDNGWASPAAIVLGHSDPCGRLHVTNATLHRAHTIADMADVIDQRTKAACEIVGLEAAARQTNQTSGKSIRGEFIAQGFKPLIYPCLVRERMAHASRWLSRHPHKCGVTIDVNCSELVHALKTHVVIFGESGSLVKSSRKSSHLVDAFTYLLLAHSMRIHSLGSNVSPLPLLPAVA